MCETINDCKHPDCIFRSTIPKPDGSCSYLMVTGHSRACSISSCDKYTSRRDARLRIKINTLYEIIWEIERGAK